MLKRFFNQNKFQLKFDTALELEQAGFKEASLYLFKKLVMEDPCCKACRYHMGRLSVELKNKEKIENQAQPENSLPENKP